VTHAFRQELTPVHFLERAGTVYADRVAVTDEGQSFTWFEFRARARRFASALRLSHFRRGDRVAFVAVNSEQLLLAHYAVPLAGGVLVALNTRLSADEIAYIVSDSGSRVVFFSPELSPSVADVNVPKLKIGPEFEAFLATGSGDELEPWLESEDDLIAVDYTSGTTARPKGVMYHHRGAYLNALGMVLANAISADSCHLWTLPMFHCNGWSHTWAMAASGSRSIALPRIDPGRIWSLLDTESVTHFNAAPTVLTMLANDPAAHRLARRVRVCTGGAPPSPTLIAQMSEFNVELVHLYGLTETYGPLTMNVLPPESENWGSVERAAYQARQGFIHVAAGSVRVVDDSMADVPTDGRTMGEVVTRGNTLMRGYFGQVRATEIAFQGGWFHTGDLGVQYPDGSIELRDRKKDIIISGGENISTIEVEQTIAAHEAVAEVAVIAVPDPKWGEVPKAFVTLRNGASASEADIIEFARERLAHFKAPRYVEFGELPKTSTGKIQKTALRDREWSGMTRRIN
jgi:fatty-acyl-CoA synthase